MNITVTADGSVILITGVPSTVITADDWTDAFLALADAIRQIPAFSVAISFPRLSKVRASMGERVLRCLWLVLRGREITPEFFPEDPEQVLNVTVPQGTTWKTVPALRKYVNPRLKTVFDPEFLVILWSKQLENFDQNDTALLPTYPKDYYNRPFRPDEIRDVVHQLRFRWALEGQDPQKIKGASPALFALVDDPFGYQVLETVYKVLVEKKTPAQKRQAILHFKQRHPKSANWNTAFLFVGMSEPLIRPECLLAEFLLSRFFYLPESSIFRLLYDFDASILDSTQKFKDDFFKKHGKTYLGVLDLDPKTMKQFYSPQQPLYFDKKAVKKYLQEARIPHFNVPLLEGIMKFFLCKRP